MSLWKQLCVIVALCGAGVLAWTQFSPEAAPARGETASSAERNGGNARGGGRGAGRAFRGGGRGDGGQRTNRVVTAEVSEAEAGNRLVAIGTAEAAKSVTLFSQTTGMVAEIAFQPGDRVGAGDTLMRLDDAEQRIAVEQARVNVEKAENAVARYERLQSSPAYSAVQAEEARVALATARNELAAAELALSRRTLMAPFDGIMGFAEVEIGDMVSNTTPIANIDDRGTVFVTFQVPERFAALLEQGKRVSATTAAYGDERFEGQVNALDTRVDAGSRSMKVRAGLPNDDDRLRPGMAFSVALQFETPGRPAVPKVAVQWDREGAYVWKVVDGQVQRARVTIISRTPDAVLVEGDIAPRDVVVAEGLEGLRDGAAVATVAAGADERGAARL